MDPKFYKYFSKSRNYYYPTSVHLNSFQDNSQDILPTVGIYGALRPPAGFITRNISQQLPLYETEKTVELEPKVSTSEFEVKPPAVQLSKETQQFKEQVGYGERERTTDEEDDDLASNQIDSFVLESFKNPVFERKVKTVVYEPESKKRKNNDDEVATKSSSKKKNSSFENKLKFV